MLGLGLVPANIHSQLTSRRAKRQPKRRRTYESKWVYILKASIYSNSQLTNTHPESRSICFEQNECDLLRMYSLGLLLYKNYHICLWQTFSMHASDNHFLSVLNQAWCQEILQKLLVAWGKVDTKLFWLIIMKIIKSSFTDTWNIINMHTYCRDDQLVELSKTKFKSAPPKKSKFSYKICFTKDLKKW